MAEYALQMSGIVKTYGGVPVLKNVDFNVKNGEIHALLGFPEDRAIIYIIALGIAAEKPVSEDVDDPSKVTYYLDENDLLHVPKLTVEAITDWK